MTNQSQTTTLLKRANLGQELYDRIFTALSWCVIGLNLPSDGTIAPVNVNDLVLQC